MKALRKILFFVFICLVYHNIFSQSQNESAPNDKYIEVSGQQKMIYDKNKGANRLLGGVTCTHRKTIMTCDSAWLYDDNTLEAFGHITLKQGDSLFISGDHLNYDGAKRFATLEGNVVCREKDMILSSKQLSYDMKTSIASYSNGGTIQAKGVNLSSKRGYYHSPSKTLSFRYNVKLNGSNYKMICDTLQYNTFSKTAVFAGPSTIFSDSTTIYTERGWYNTGSEKCLLSKNPQIKTGKQVFKGDSMIYDRKKTYSLILGNIEISDSTEATTIKGKKAEHWQMGGLSIVSGMPMCMKYFKKDTLFIKADTFYTWSDIKSPEKALRAWYNCSFYKNDMQGICDSITFTSTDSLMILHKSPILWSDSSQLTARKILIKTGKKSIKNFSLLDNAMLVSMKDSINFNQIKGKTIDGIFEKDSLRKIIVKGNAQAIYFFEQKKKIIAMNRTDCSEMTLMMNSKGVENISFIKKPTASIKPIKEIKQEEKKLKGFVWLWQKKPAHPNLLSNKINK